MARWLAAYVFRNVSDRHIYWICRLIPEMCKLRLVRRDKNWNDGRSRAMRFERFLLLPINQDNLLSINYAPEPATTNHPYASHYRCGMYVQGWCNAALGQKQGLEQIRDHHKVIGCIL